MTDTIRHHPSDALLMAYSAGTLPEAFNLIVAAHLSLCDECRARLAAFDAVGGALVESSAEAEMSAGSLEQTLALIASGRPEKPASPDIGDGILPAPVCAYVGGGLEAVNWRPMGKGVKQAILPTSREATARLIFIPAGVAVPDHGHRGTELTLVLQGAFADKTDRFARGDIETGDEELHHAPAAETGADCICLSATDAPLKFKGFLPRLAQPFLKI